MNGKFFKVALIGNPNCGKTSIFNILTGTRQHVGNYSGVTIEKKSGFSRIGEMKIELVDLPGIYSLSSSYSEGLATLSELSSGDIDIIINVVDSTIPSRSLYLTRELSELGIPMLLALNMSDEAEKNGINFDIKKLEKYFSSPVVRTVGRNTEGVSSLVEKLSEIVRKLDVPKNGCRYGYESRKAFLRKIAAISNESTFESGQRHTFVSEICKETVFVAKGQKHDISDRIDSVVTDRLLGLPIFLIIMYITFYLTFTFAAPFCECIEYGFSILEESIKSVWDESEMPFLRRLVSEGIFGGVGGVLVFLPNILFLFLAISLLEGSGYMPRAAFVMDGIMRRFGLQGKSFVPLVLGFGCNVPAIMATRTIDSERDRKTTVLVLPFMSCGARLPIYALIIPAFFPLQYQAIVMCGIYAMGIFISFVAAFILKKTLFKGDRETYIMELPPYRIPTIGNLFLDILGKGKSYLRKAGTIIFAASVVLYIANNYPEKSHFSKDYDSLIERLGQESSPAAKDEIAVLENEKKAEICEYTISGRVGKSLEPVFSHIGFDWKLTTACIGALAAKELFVSQLAILYAQEESEDENAGLVSCLKQNYSPLRGFCVMVFCLLSIPCLATLAVIKRELDSWKAVFLEAAALLATAYFVTFAIYQIGSALEIGI